MGAIKATQDNAVAISKVYEQEKGYKASATVTIGTNPSDGNTITFNGTKFTFRDSPDVDSDVAIGSDITATRDNLLTEALPDAATYTASGTDSIFIEYATIGTDGNDYTIDCDFTDVPNNLSGGSDTPDGDWVDNTPAINYKLPEILVDGDTTSTALKSFNVVAEGDNVRLYNDTDGLVTGSLGDVTTADAEAVNIHDIFEDGSAVATYQLDGDATDLGGNYDGDAHDVTYDTGKFGDCGVFTDSSYIDIGANYGFGDNSILTVSMFVYLTSYSAAGEEQCLFDFADGAKARDCQVDDSGNLICSGYSGGFTSTLTISLNTWTNVVCIFDDTSVTLYVDNESDTGTISYDSRDYTNNIGNNNNNSNGVKGSIDQVRIFNKALTDDEVNILYNEQIPKYQYKCTIPYSCSLISKDSSASLAIKESSPFKIPSLS